MSYFCMKEGCTEKVDWRYCYTHSRICKQCGTREDCLATFINCTGLCRKCIRENKLVKEISEFVCPICGSTNTVRNGNKYACWEGDALNYRRRKNHIPHGRTYS